MADTIKIGKVNVPKPVAFGALAAAGAIVAYAYWNRSRGGGGGEDTPADGSELIDPATGLPYDDAGLGSASGLGIYDPSTGGTFGIGYGQTVTQVSTNAAWTQAVMLYFDNTYEREVMSRAFGKVFSGQAITQEELNIFNAGRAVMGEPPQSYPSIHMASAAPGGTTNPAAKTPTNLHRGTVTRTTIEIAWNRVAGATGYVIYAKGASGIQTIGNNAGENNTRFVHRGLKPNTSHVYYVAAKNSGGTSAKTGALTVKTGK